MRDPLRRRRRDRSRHPSRPSRTSRAERQHDRRHREDDREGEREAGESHHLARFPRPRFHTDAARTEPDHEAEQEVAGRPVEQPADERDDGQHDPVERLLVEKRPPGRRQEDAGHPGNDDDREDRLGARVDIDLVVLAKRDEDVDRRRQQPRQEAPPPPDEHLRGVRALVRHMIGRWRRLDVLLTH